jgi:hypothetical protein
MVVTEHSTQAVSTVDASVRWEVGEFRPDNLVSEPLMVSLFVIMQDELRGGSLCRPWANANQVWSHKVSAGLYPRLARRSTSEREKEGSGAIFPFIVTVLQRSCHGS